MANELNERGNRRESREEGRSVESKEEWGRVWGESREMPKEE
jgi:hypothetical protein